MVTSRMYRRFLVLLHSPCKFSTVRCAILGAERAALRRRTWRGFSHSRHTRIAKVLTTASFRIVLERRRNQVRSTLAQYMKKCRISTNSRGRTATSRISKVRKSNQKSKTLPSRASNNRRAKAELLLTRNRVKNEREQTAVQNHRISQNASLTTRNLVQ